MSAVAELPVAAAIPVAVPAAGLAGRWQGLSRGQRLRFMLGTALLVAAALAAVVFSRQADWKVLYANLPDKDGGAIVAQLATMNVPYKYAEGGAAILVPADRVHDVRLKLASQGLPKSSVAGFELMENNRFGMTQFQERLTFQRGLEGELTRSIQALSSVQSARIHLALPNQNGFFREQQKPSASVLLTLYPGRVLDRAQIAGIVHLVASSVPEMPPAAVSVLDDSGKLLSAPPDGAGVGGAGGDGQQLQYVQQIEREYTRRILDILEPVVGRNNVKAQVAAEVDFSQSESTSEQHRPNQAADAGAIRSQQTTEVTGPGSAPAAGVPGATTNQPPAQPAAPINGQAVATAGAGGAPGAAGNSKRESITNYEVDKTVKVTRAGSGAIKRLSAAVVVNYQMPTAAQAAAIKGAPTPQALSAQQIEQMTALVRETIGFSKDRGDSVNLMNTPFLVEAPDTTALPLWKQPEVLEWARSLGWPVGMLAFALAVILGLVRPVLRAGRAPAPALPEAVAASPGSQLNTLVEDAPERAALAAPGAAQPLAIAMTPEQGRLEDARRLAKENPTAVANIVKNWVSGEMAA